MDNTVEQKSADGSVFPSVWPPPPDALPALSMEFRGEYIKPLYTGPDADGHVSGSVGDFRGGQISITPEGVKIDGRAVLPAEVQFPWMAVAALTLVPFFFASLFLEYIVRTPRNMVLEWNNVEWVIADATRRKAAIIYKWTNSRGKLIHNTLTFHLDGILWDHFLGVLNRYIPDKVTQGPVGFAMHLHVRLFFGAIGFWLLVTFVLAIAAGLWRMWLGT